MLDALIGIAYIVSKRISKRTWILEAAIAGLMEYGIAPRADTRVAVRLPIVTGITGTARPLGTVNAEPMLQRNEQRPML